MSRSKDALLAGIDCLLSKSEASDFAWRATVIVTAELSPKVLAGSFTFDAGHNDKQEFVNVHELGIHLNQAVQPKPIRPGKLLVYTAGPYRDPRGIIYVESNIRQAEHVAQQLWQMGYSVICPHLNTKHFDGLPGVQSDDFIVGDLVMVERCDLVVLLPGWEASEGAKKECAHALAHGVRLMRWDRQEQEIRQFASGLEETGHQCLKMPESGAA